MSRPSLDATSEAAALVDKLRRRGAALVTLDGESYEVRCQLHRPYGDPAAPEELFLSVDDLELVVAACVERALS